MKTIFLLNPDSCVTEEVKEFLELSGFLVKSFKNMKLLEKTLEMGPPDMIISEITMEDGNGFMLLKKIRNRYSYPFIFLSRRTDESSRILAFEIGADDYLTIPCSTKELVLRVKAIFKRIDDHAENRQKNDAWKLGKLSLFMDKEAHNYYLDGKEINFTASEWKILSTLTTEPGMLFSRNHLLQLCFDSTAGYDRIIDNHIKNIRNKIGSAWIETVRSYGYRFAGDCFDRTSQIK